MPFSTASRVAHLAAPAGAAVLLLLLPPPAAAQKPGDPQRAQAVRQASIAARQARTDALAVPEDPAQSVGIAPPRGEAASPLALDLLLPILLNTNPDQASQSVSAVEVTPNLRLTWTQALSALPLRLTALIDVGADRYSRVPQGDSDLNRVHFGRHGF
jgi:hypothetical protein